MVKNAVAKPRKIKDVDGNVETRKVSDLTPHPYANQVFGKPSKHEIEELGADMETFGQRDKIDIDRDNRVLNGRTRLEAAILKGMKELQVIVHDLDDEAAKKFILEANLLRHHYDRLTVARVFLELKALLRGDKGRAPKTGAGDLRDRLAKRFKISGRSLDRHVKMLGTPAAAQELYRKGVLSDSVMVALASLTAEQQKAVLAVIKRFGGNNKEKNATAKTEISNFRKENRDERAKAKAAAADAAKASANVEKTASNEESPSDAETEGQDATEPVATTSPGDDAVHDDGDPEAPAAELPADHGVTGDDDAEAEHSHDNVATDEASRTKSMVGASDTVEVEEPVEEPAENTEEDASIGTYRKVLVEMPATFEKLVEQMDGIIGEVMDPDAAVEALQRMATSIQALIEAEKTKAAALAGVSA